MATLTEIDEEIRKRGLSISKPIGPQQVSLADIDAEIQKRKQKEPKGFFGAQIIEPAAALISGALAEPAAGIAGLAAGVLTRDPAAAAAVVEGVRERLTFEPRTEAGQAGLQTAGEVVQPLVESFQELEQTLGDETLDFTGSPVLAAAAKTLPTALLEIVGAASLKGVTKLKTGRSLDNAIKEAAPSPEQLKNASRAVFKEIEDLGITVKPEGLDRLTSSIEKAARSSGGSPRTTKAAFGVIDDFKEVVESGKTITLTELDELRTVAQNAAKTIDPAQKAPALAIIDEIDVFLDGAGTGILNRPKGAPNVGKEYKAARQLWGRARRAELLNEAVIKAKDTASGFENGLRIEFRKILKNRRQSKFFNEVEKAALNRVSQGTKASNLAKLIGRLGITEGQAINIINPLGGAAAGGIIFGTPGAIAVPVIGQVSKQLAQKLTRNNSRLANQVVRAGTNAEEITKAYIRNTPKNQRSAVELSQLLIRNEVNLKTARSALAKDAAKIATQIKSSRIGAVSGGLLRPEEKE